MVGAKFKFTKGGTLYTIAEYNPQKGYRITYDTNPEGEYYSKSKVDLWLLEERTVVIKPKVIEIW